ncbi:hypothetical protein ACS0TY_011685 [Phlomoides rotata]
MSNSIQVFHKAPGHQSPSEEHHSFKDKVKNSARKVFHPHKPPTGNSGCGEKKHHGIMERIKRKKENKNKNKVGWRHADTTTDAAGTSSDTDQD